MEEKAHNPQVMLYTTFISIKLKRHEFGPLTRISTCTSSDP